MTDDMFFASVTICACSGLFLLWELGFRKLFLEDFRDSLFVVRKRLYALAQEGSLDCNAPEYRALESLLNGIIRYAHRFSFSMLVLSRIEMQRRQSTDQYDFAESLLKKINANCDARVRLELQAIVVDTGFLLAKYIARSSLSFVGISVLRRLRKETATKQHAISTFEREAYNAYESDGRKAAVA